MKPHCLSFLLLAGTLQGAPPSRCAALCVFPVSDLRKTLCFWKERIGLELRTRSAGTISPEAASRLCGTKVPQPCETFEATSHDGAVRVLFVCVHLQKPTGQSQTGRAPVRALLRVARLPDAVRAAGSVQVAAGELAYVFLTDPDGNLLCVTAPTSRGIALWNGKDLAGWHLFRKAHWFVEDGVLVGEQGPNNAGGWLVTDKDFSDFTLTFSFRLSRGANSGVCVRYPDQGPPPKTGVEIQLSEADPSYRTGSIFGVKAAPEGLYRAGWNQGKITVKGKVVTCWINTRQAATARVPRMKEQGKIALQIHGGPQYAGTFVSFKDLRLVPLGR